MLNYNEYEALFNTGDDAALIARFFDADIVFTGGAREYRGKAELKAFLDWAHDGVRERLTINSVKTTDSTIELDAITRFTAIRDAPDFVVGALRTGDYIEGRVIVNYQLRGGLISRISVRRGGEMVKHEQNDYG
jgi:hypothetical protein